MGGTFATALGLIKIVDNPSGQAMAEEEYIVPAAVGNTLCVVFLIWLTATIPTRSTAYKLTVIVVLLVGLIGEIYLTFFFTSKPAVYGTYVLVVVNFLIRTFYVLEYVQDTWSPVSWRDYPGAPKQSSGPSKPSESKPAERKPDGERKPLDDVQRLVSKTAKDKLETSIKLFKAEPSKQYDGKTIQDAIQAVNKEVTAGKTADEAFRSAKSLLKYKDGSSYTGAGRHA
jgi:hypothetical protein